jgi:hypothetical protein
MSRPEVFGDGCGTTPTDQCIHFASDESLDGSVGSIRAGSGNR